MGCICTRKAGCFGGRRRSRWLAPEGKGYSILSTNVSDPKRLRPVLPSLYPLSENQPRFRGTPHPFMYN